MLHLLALLVTAVFVLHYLSTKRKHIFDFVQRNKGERALLPSQEGKVNNDDPSVFEARNIIPLPDFDLNSTEPLKLRPFKPKYHLTMGLTNVPVSSYLVFDSTYLSRIAQRASVISKHPDIAIQCSPTGTPALNELYTWLFGIYLPTRYPTIFTLTSTHVLNLAFSPPRYIPLSPPASSFDALRVIGENIDQDFLILLPDEKSGEYVLQAFVTCCPSGFNTKEKFGLTLKKIHAPVPGYKEKIEKSMDRFFSRVEVGKMVARMNWAVTTTSELFTPNGTHLYEGQDPKDEAEFNMNDVHLRVESQTLHRLPTTRALVFSFKTYLYPISSLKTEYMNTDVSTSTTTSHAHVDSDSETTTDTEKDVGTEGGMERENNRESSALVLAKAIEGLKGGSVPHMWFYKRGVVWGERVLEYLRS